MWGFGALNILVYWANFERSMLKKIYISWQAKSYNQRSVWYIFNAYELKSKLSLHKFSSPRIFLFQSFIKSVIKKEWYMLNLKCNEFAKLF